MCNVISLKLHFPKKEFVFITEGNASFPSFSAALPFAELQVERTLDALDILIHETSAVI